LIKYFRNGSNHTHKCQKTASTNPSSAACFTYTAVSIIYFKNCEYETKLLNIINKYSLIARRYQVNSSTTSDVGLRANFEMTCSAALQVLTIGGVTRIHLLLTLLLLLAAMIFSILSLPDC